ncbi:hypothetical protein BpHYR1_010824 [Brachionus plicatilis]|uniref:Uncharacterized protein n=1 Tax=Brachionus plicatilis TaxID=10195 RepID=A0A3M7R6E9_BRAPC|nr:hypothetical protein BpHYR1_010824 [Brachionus plicatilis]
MIVKNESIVAQIFDKFFKKKFYVSASLLSHIDRGKLNCFYKEDRGNSKDRQVRGTFLADLQSFRRDLIWVIQSLYQLIRFAEPFLDSNMNNHKKNFLSESVKRNMAIIYFSPTNHHIIITTAEGQSAIIKFYARSLCELNWIY